MILGFMLSRLSFSHMLHDIWMKIATSYAQKDGNSQHSLLIIFLILHSHTRICQHLGFQFHFVVIGALVLFVFFWFRVCEQGK